MVGEGSRENRRRPRPGVDASARSEPSVTSTSDRFSLGALEFESIRSQIGALVATSAGRARTTSLAPHPSGAEARAMLARTVEAMALHGAELVPSFLGIEDLRSPLDHLAEGGRPLEGPDLARAARTLRQCSVVRAHLLALTQRAPVLAALAAAMPECGDLVEEIERIVDARGEVLDSASPRLADARARIRQLEEETERVLGRVLARPEVRRILNAPKPTWRHHRPVLAVKAEYRHRISGMLLDRSATGSTVYIEPEEAVELGNALAEASLVAAREISVVLVEASRRMLAHRATIVLVLDRVGDLDVEFAKAAWAAPRAAVVPEIVEGRRLRIEGARHPGLLESVEAGRPAAQAVAIDVEIGGSFDLLIVTGPNTGGKTVALKTVGLLAVMALSGLPVPARRAEIPELDGVFVDIGDEQAISQSLSTFSSHMVRVGRALRLATPRSLVLIDEIGAGTDPAEGAALGEAILEHFLERSVRTIATTHLGKLKQLAWRHSNAQNATVEFDAATLRPLYRLLIGLPGSSHAIDVARRMGIGEAILERAEQRVERKDHGTEEAAEAIQTVRRAADAERRLAERSLQEAEESRSAAADRLRAVEERGKTLEAEAQKSLDASIGRLRALLVARFDALMAAAPKPFDARLREAREELEAAIREDPLERKREEFLGSLKRDDVIFVPKFRRRCPVRRVNHTKRIVTVLVGDLPADVRFDEVTWYEVL